MDSEEENIICIDPKTGSPSLSQGNLVLCRCRIWVPPIKVTGSVRLDLGEVLLYLPRDKAVCGKVIVMCSLGPKLVRERAERIKVIQNRGVRIEKKKIVRRGFFQ